MKDSLPIQYDFSLRNHNTFGIDACAHAYLPVDTGAVLSNLRQACELSELPRMVLGGGSNIVLTRDFPGIVLHMCGKGIGIVGEDAHATYVRAAAGENWHGFVQWTLAHGLNGLENLSFIPGNVGAAPIQNIGAYGVEVKDYVHSVSAFDFETGHMLSLEKAACAFGYRDSVFKNALRDRAVILDVTFALPKQWRPQLDYADVAQEIAARQIASPTACEISDAVIAIRTRKLPDPRVIGNAGSFFKNPIVPAVQRNALLEEYPRMVSYAQPDGNYKLAAGWLIDQCGWKGRSIGRAGVYEKQALVLVNRGGATGSEVQRLAAEIQADVHSRFGVVLEAEPVFV